MRILKAADKLTRLSMIILFLFGLSACGETPGIAVKKLVAESHIGADNPPLPPLETRVPQFKQVFADVAEKVIPVVVSIRSAKVMQVPNFDPFEWFFGPGRGNPQQQPGPRYQERRTEGIGSGVIVSKDGYILTNNHVVEGSEDLTVTISDKREFSAKIVGTDPPTDLAVIKLEGASDLPVAYLGDSDKLRVGEWVLAIGSPYGLEETVTMGIVSARGRSGREINTYENFIQTDAAINPGNSGGALVNMDGAVIGINSVIYSQTGGNAGIGFAIPINMAKDIMGTLISQGRVSRGWLGVSIKDVDPETASSLNVKPNKGAIIAEVLSGSPADKAGIKTYDIIIKVNGNEINSANELRNKVAMIKPGTKATFTILRDGKEINFEIVLAERKFEEEQAAGGTSEATKTKTGLSLENLTPQIKRQYQIDENQKGVLVVDVDPKSAAARTGLHEGDIILDADRKPVNSVAEFNSIISQVKGETVLLRVQGDNGTRLVPLKLTKK